MSIVKVYLIVGYRRWARVIAEELCANLKNNTNVYLVGDPHNKELQIWLYSSGLNLRIKIINSIKPLSAKSLGVAFVINSAYLHKPTIKELLNKGYNVVCEKPISFSTIETKKLISFAVKKKLQLFCTNTYAFASYLQKLKTVYLKKNKYCEIKITWTDPKKEIRYKLNKSYDSGVPIIYDVLPHIANIIYLIIGNCKLRLIKIDLKKGGSFVSIHYRLKNINIFIKLERNAIKRQRFIEFVGPKNQCYFDFTNEPGFVSIDNRAKSKIEKKWSIRPKPISAMIKSVICFFEKKKKDNRLSLLASLLGNKMIDAVAKNYVSSQIEFIDCQKKRLTGREYALKELKSVKNRTLKYVYKYSPLYKLKSIK